MFAGIGVVYARTPLNCVHVFPDGSWVVSRPSGHYRQTPMVGWCSVDGRRPAAASATNATADARVRAVCDRAGRYNAECHVRYVDAAAARHTGAS